VEGWVAFDPRSKRFCQIRLRLKDRQLHVVAFDAFPHNALYEVALYDATD
jgi:hypothetical protein